MSAFLKNLNIRTRLLLLCLAVSLPLLAICGLVIWKEYRGLTQMAHRATTFHNELATRTLQKWINTQQTELKALSLSPALTSHDVAGARELLAAEARLQSHVNGLVLLDRDGRLIAASDSNIKQPSIPCVVNLEPFKKALSGQAMVTGYMMCPVTEKPAVILSQPVVTDGKVSAVLLKSIKPAGILQLFSGTTESKGFVVAVVDKNNRVIARTLDSERWAGKDFSHAKTVTAAHSKRKGSIEVVGIADPTLRTYAFDRVPSTGWLVIVGIPTQVIYGSADERLLLLVLCTVLAVVVSIGLAYGFTGHFTGPIQSLVREAVAIGRGDLSKRVQMVHGGELGLLARAFNQMALNLELNREHKAMIERISESIRQSLDLTEILNTTVSELGEALGSSRCCLAIVDDAYAPELLGSQLEFNYVWFDQQANGAPLKNRSVVITEGSILKLILEQGAILSLDVMGDETFTPLFESADESPEDWKSIKSLIACPILLKNRPMGMILVHQCDRRRAWIELELELVEAVARHVALALDHANMFARTRQMAEQEHLINQIVRATRTSLDSGTILETVTAELGKALGVDYCQIAQPGAESPLVVTYEYCAEGLPSQKGTSLYGSQMDFHPGADNPDELRSVLGIDLSSVLNIDQTEIEERAKRKGIDLHAVPVSAISDIESDRRAQKFYDYLETMASKSLMAVPLLRDDRVLGMLIVHQCRKKRHWQSSEVRLLTAVADQLAVAISHVQLFEQVKYQAITDGLTGLYNHIYFKNRLSEELNRCQRKGTPCSLLMLDLDKLKQINDTFGHPVGDAAIRQVAIALKSLLRSGDTAARYGGEEFAVVLPDTPLSEAVQIADRLRRHVNRGAVPGLGHISTSIGAAAFPDQSTAIDDLIDKADRALYFAKRSGRNRVCVWDEPAPSMVAIDESAAIAPEIG